MRTAFLLLMTVTLHVSVTASADAQTSSREQAIAKLLQADVRVERDEAQPGQPVTRIFFGCHRGPGSLVRELEHIPEVEILNLRLNHQVTAEDLRGLRALVNLRELVIHHCPIKAGSLAHLENMARLRSLKFASTPISDEGLQHIAHLKNLEQLEICGKGVTDQGLRHLEGMTTLKTLRLSKTSVTDDRLQALQSTLPNARVYK